MVIGRSEGFTLLEAVITLIVFAVVATFCIVGYNGLNKKAQDKIAKAVLKKIRNAERTERLKTGFYAACDNNPQCKKVLGIEAISSVWNYKVGVSNFGKYFCAAAYRAGRPTWRIASNEVKPVAGACALAD